MEQNCFEQKIQLTKLEAAPIPLQLLYKKYSYKRHTSFAIGGKKNYCIPKKKLPK